VARTQLGEGERSRTLDRTAVGVAVLFLLATVTYTIGNGLVRSVTDSATPLEHAYPDRTRLAVGALLEFVDAAAAVGIGVLLLPVLRRRSEVAALSYFASRVIEATLVVVGALCAVAVVIVGRDAVAQGGVSGSHRVLGDVLVQSGYSAFRASMIALGLGSLFLCWVLYDARLVPRAMSVLGLVGYALLMLWGAVGIVQRRDATTALFVPGAIFELVFPVWLLIRGFTGGVPEGDRP
jgi:hypothetical protein